MLGVERHLLDEAQLVAALEAPLEQLGCLGVVDTAQQHRIDLHRCQSHCLRRLEPADDVVEPVAPGDRAERVRPDRVEADVDPVESRLGERRRDALEADAVGRHRDAWPRVEVRRTPDDVGEAATDQRLAPGEPHLVDPEMPDGDVDEAQDLVVGEESSPGSQSSPSAGMQ